MMNVPFIIAVVSLALQFATTAALFILGRAPRWRRVRWFGAVALTAGCYSTVDAIAALRVAGETDVSWSLRANLVFATLHGAAWLVFTYIGRDGKWSGLPLWLRRTVVVAITAALVGGITGVVAAPERELLLVPSLGVSYERPVLSPIGTVLGVVPFLLLSLAMFGVWQERRRGVQGSTPVLVGFVLFLLAAVEELLVAAGVVQFIFLGDLGYICVVVPLTLQLFRRFRDDADQLDLLTEHLADEVTRRTEERDRARALMIDQQRLAALGRLAAGVGHEINNPLQYLRFTLEELREQLRQPPHPEAARLVEHAFEGVDRIAQVVVDLRTYVRPGEAMLAPLDVREVVRAALRVGAPQWRQGVRIVTDLGDVPLVAGHEGRLVQVVLNPLVNGVQALAHAADVSRQTLWVATATLPNGWAEITVRDEGRGFAPEVMSRLGEPYVSTKSGDGGTGLGLFVSRGIVEAHGGIMLFANDPRGGAIVRVQLPPLESAVAARPTLAGALAPGAMDAAAPVAVGAPGALHVLLVEDDAAAMRALQRGLELEGIRVTGFTDARAALLWLAGHEVDLVVTDLMMPGMSGWEFASALAQRHASLRETLVVLTGGASTSEAERFLCDEGLLVLGKPISRQELARQLRCRVESAAAPISPPGAETLPTT
jgi:signal transduction histidine kinase/ActR/RegA family two-component response regulator